MYEGSICACCMATDNLQDLFHSGIVNGVVENYSKMLNSCLNIQLLESDGHDSICEDCTSKLRDCVAFKRQALTSLSIISSVDITELLSPEDFDVLGLGEQKHGKSLEYEEVEHLDIEKDDCKAVDSSVNYNTDENIEDTTPPSTKKRGRGRPRKYPRDKVPYKIDKHELTCRECGEEFPNNVTLKIHYNSHFRNHVCRTCDKGFMTIASLKKHETSHLTGPFSCNVCGQEFRSVNTLYSHKRYKHGSGEPYGCSECGARFGTLQRRLAHCAAEHARTERRHACRYCGKRFRNGSERSKHVADKHELRLFPCPLCGVRYKKYYMRAHLLRRHRIGRGHACTQCSAIQPSQSALHKHMLSHLDERRFSCKLCSKAFIQKCTLQYHIRSHIRRGQYRGDPGYLIVDKRDPTAKDTGLLSDTEDNPGEQCVEESIVSEDQSFELIEEIDGFLLDDERFQLPSDLDVGS